MKKPKEFDAKKKRKKNLVFDGDDHFMTND